MIRAGAAAGRAAAGLVLLHGRGGSARDILGLADALALPDLAVIAPEAPGGSWWPASFLSPSAVMEPPLSRALAQVAAAIAALEAEGLARSHIWLAGFSQGAGLAMESFARLGDGLAGVFGLSGGLIGTSDGPWEPKADLYGHTDKLFDYPGRRGGAKVWLSVHAQDPHIPLARVQASAAVFRAMGAEVTLHVEPGAGHSILAQDVARMRALLNQPA
jgi:phospholipase/carboxylesterase